MRFWHARPSANGIRGQIDRLQRWRRRHRAGDLPQYDGYSTETLAWATPAELQDLSERLRRTLDEWRTSIDRTDGQERMPVFFFSHAFPTEP